MQRPHSNAYASTAYVPRNRYGASWAVATFDTVKQHLKHSLLTHSPDEVVAYLQKWAQPGRELVLLLGSGYVQYPSVADLPGRHEPQEAIPMPWMFNSPQAADLFCTLLEQAFASAGAKCTIAGRQR